MPNFGSHLSGPVRHATRGGRNQSRRAWFRELPIGMNDPDHVHHFLEFEKVTDYSTTDYTLNSSGSGGFSAGVNTAAKVLLGSSAMSVNGALLIQTGSTAGNYAHVQSKVLGWQLDKTPFTGPSVITAGIGDQKSLWFEAAFSADVSATDVDCFIGLAENAASVVGPATTNNYIGFKIANGSTTISYVASTGGTVTSGSAALGSGNSVAMVQGTLNKVGFLFSGSNTVDFYINRNFINSISAGFPTGALALSYQIVTNSATNRSLVLDYVYAAKLR